MDDVLRRLRAEIADALEKAADLVEQMPVQEYQATSPDEMVTATVSGGGRLLRISIDPRARSDVDNVTLGEHVRDAVNAADAEAAAVLRRSLGGMSVNGVALDTFLGAEA
jgi:DNA-binding protein YbaB